MRFTIDLSKPNEELRKHGYEPYPIEVISVEATTQEEMDQLSKFYQNKFNEWSMKEFIAQNVKV